MSEAIIVAIVGVAGTIGGAMTTNMFAAAKNRLEAYQLAQEMQADNQRLWQWNRALVDHIYKGLGPPPPSPKICSNTTIERKTWMASSG